MKERMRDSFVVSPRCKSAGGTQTMLWKGTRKVFVPQTKAMLVYQGTSSGSVISRQERGTCWIEPACQAPMKVVCLCPFCLAGFSWASIQALGSVAPLEVTLKLFPAHSPWQLPWGQEKYPQTLLAHGKWKGLNVPRGRSTGTGCY